MAVAAAAHPAYTVQRAGGRGVESGKPMPDPSSAASVATDRAPAAGRRQPDDRLLILDLDTFTGSERFMQGTNLGAAFATGMRAYLNTDYRGALNEFKRALIAAYVEGDDLAQIWERERAIIHLYLGNCYANLDEWAAAQNEYTNAVQIDDRLAEGHYNLGVAFRAHRELPAAIGAFKTALGHNPDLYEARFALGRCYHDLGDYAHAYIAYTVARQYRPNAAEPIYYQGLLHQAHGEEKQAAKCFAEALLVEPGYKFNSPTVAGTVAEAAFDDSAVQDAAWYYRLADELKLRSNLIGAIRSYQALLEISPSEVRARYLLANILARQREWPHAIAEYSRVLETRPDYVQARHKLGLALRALQRLREAYQTLVDCARLQPYDGSIFLSLGIVLTDMAQIRYAVQAFVRATQLLPDDPQAHYRLGRALITLGYEKRALAAWQRAIELDHSWHAARYDLGVLYLRQEHYARAIEHFEAVLKGDADDLEAAYFLAIAYKETGRLEETVMLLERVVQGRAGLFMAHFHLGATLLRLGNSTRGLHHIRQYEVIKARLGERE